MPVAGKGQPEIVNGGGKRGSTGGNLAAVFLQVGDHRFQLCDIPDSGFIPGLSAVEGVNLYRVQDITAVMTQFQIGTGLKIKHGRLLSFGQRVNKAGTSCDARRRFGR